MNLPRRPFVHLNLAVSGEGRVATRDGRPMAISCEQDWRRVHLLRESYDGVAVGARTWRLDRPRLTVRREVLGRAPARQPARVIFAGGQPVELGVGVDRATYVVGRQAPAAAEARFVAEPGRELARPLAGLADLGLRSLLVEGGPTLLRSFLDQGCYDRLSIYVPTGDGGAARRAVAEALPMAPCLNAAPFAGGFLLQAEGPAPASEPTASAARAELAERVVYLDPDTCGLANGGGRGERIALLGPVPLPIVVRGIRHTFAWSVFARVPAGEALPTGVFANSLLVYGDPGAPADPGIPPLVRIHSSCQTGDIFGSARCDCGPQLQQALAAIVDAGRGVAVYAADHEGRGVGLWNKACAYLLQDAGADTYQANLMLGCPEDSRHYGDVAVVLAHQLGRRAIRLLSNNPAKKNALVAAGFEIAEMVGLLAGHNEVNRLYLDAKARRGHLLPRELSAFSETALPVGSGSG